MEKAHAYEREHSAGVVRSEYNPGEIKFVRGSVTQLQVNPFNPEHDADVVAETAMSDTIHIRPGY